MSNINLTVDQINKMKPCEIVQNDMVRQRFVQIYNTLWGEDTGEAAYERESIFFNKYLEDKPDVANAASRFSIFTAFIDLAVCGLSIEQGVRALCYLSPRRTQVGVNEKGQKMYENRILLTVSGYGELVLRARCGQIRYADNPVLVYENDEFSFSDINGRKTVSYTCHLPHKGNIVACFLRITRTDGSIDYAVMFEEDWHRLAQYSSKQNRYYDREHGQWVEKGPNELYKSNNGSIDTGFLMAKCIKHAFKTYPKVRIGKGTELQTEQEQPQQNMDFYGVSEAESSREETVAPPFGEQPDYSAGVTVQTANNNADDDGAF